MSKKQSSQRKGTQQLFYTEAFKQKIVNEVLSGKLNKRQASLIYGIKGNATILYWINQSHWYTTATEVYNTVAMLM